MNIVLFGGSGFIGRRTVKLLRRRGHRVDVPSRGEADYLGLDEHRLAVLLEGADAVINAVGIMSHNREKLETVHHTAPKMIAAAARLAGVPAFIQLSALGARPDYATAFLGSKGRGDEELLQSGLNVRIARPSVVFGRGGASCELFIRLARLPVLPLPEGGYYRLQPVHADDVAEGLCYMAEQPAAVPAVVEMTGSRACSLAEYLNLLRANIHGKCPAKILRLPAAWVDLAARCADRPSNGMFGSDSMKLLREGSVADCAGLENLLGRRVTELDMFGL